MEWPKAWKGTKARELVRLGKGLGLHFFCPGRPERLSVQCYAISAGMSGHTEGIPRLLVAKAPILQMERCVTRLHDWALSV